MRNLLSLSRYWMDFSSPQLASDSVQLNLAHKERVGGATTRLHFHLTGPPRIVVFLSPSPGANVTSWSVTDSEEAHVTRHRWRDRDGYLATFLTGGGDVYDTAWRFWLELESSSSPEKASLTVFASGHHTHGPSRTASKEFRALLQQFPDWTFPWSWTVDLRGYEFTWLD